METPLEKLNQQLEENGEDTLQDFDPCPERTNYLEHVADPKWKNDEWVKKLKKLEKYYLDNFHKYVASKFPHLLFEKTNDKVYWMYDSTAGVYFELTFPEVRNILIEMLLEEGFESHTSELFVKNVLNKYRALFKERGVLYDDFDTDSDWFHAKNGWVNLDTKEFEGHTPNRLSKKASAVEFDADAQCPLYDKFLDEDVQMPEDQVRVIDQYSGYILTEGNQQEQMLIFEGRPGSGKSMVPETWSYVMGNMACKSNLRQIGGLMGGDNKFGGSKFANRTFCYINESNPKTRDFTETVQDMIDGNTIEIQRKGIQGEVDVKNRLKLLLSLNEMPDHMPPGMSRRYVHIYFGRSFEDEGIKDSSIKETIKQEELSGVLNRMLRGLDDFRKMGGLTSIAGEGERRREHTIAADDFSEFLVEHFVPTNDGHVRYNYKQMRDAFVAEFPKPYNKNLSIQAFNKKLITNRLSEFSKIEKKRSDDRRGYAGLKLKEGHEFSDFSEHEIEVLGYKTRDDF